MRKLFNYSHFDLIKRKKFKQRELRFLLIKALLRELKLDLRLRVYLMMVSHRRTFTRIRSRCLITGKGRSLVRTFGLSRMPFKLLINNGRIPGFRKDMF